MKIIKSSLLILALCGLVLSSCKKSGSSPSTTVSMSLKFNGTAKNTSIVVASYYVSENTLQVIGTFNSTEAVSLMINNIKTGTFALPSNDIVASYSTSADFANTYLGDTGSITITSFTSDAVSGTFQFTGTNPSNATGAVTEGKFYAKIFKVQQ